MNALSKMVSFGVQSEKFTPGRKIYTDGVTCVTNNYEVCPRAQYLFNPLECGQNLKSDYVPLSRIKNLKSEVTTIKGEKSDK